MRRNLLASAVAFGLVLVAGSSAYAQAPGKEVVAKVEFEFKAGDQLLPAGSYRIEQRRNSPALSLRSLDGAHSAQVAVITRLARQKNPAGEGGARLVFDTVAGERFLSEIWMPGVDGYLVRGTPQEHQHTAVEIQD